MNRTDTGRLDGDPQHEAVRIVALALAEQDEQVNARLRTFGRRYGSGGTRWLVVYLCQVIEHNIETDEPLGALLLGVDLDDPYSGQPAVRAAVTAVQDLLGHLCGDDPDAFAARWKQVRDQGQADATVSVLVYAAAAVLGLHATLDTPHDHPLRLAAFPLPDDPGWTGTHGYGCSN